MPILSRYVSALLLSVVLLLTSTCAHFIVEKNSIAVISPNHLRSRHDGAIANFGIPNYGGTMMGIVVYPENSTSGCSSFNISVPTKSPYSPSHIILVDRGDCYFAMKVWNGQEAGASAVLVADTNDGPLITMDSPEENRKAEEFIEKVKIPSALIDRSFGDSLKKALQKGEEVVVRLDWTESMPHPDEKVEFELWTNSNDECGTRCYEQISFIKNFKGHAQILEKGGYTQFAPHYITWFCPEDFIESKQCKSQCINHGRYCAPDPEEDFSEGYEGKDVVLENLRQLCVHRVAKERNQSWVWWDFVTDFHMRCSMKNRKYSEECAQEVVKSLDFPLEKIQKCMGDTDADVDNEVLKAEQELQVGHGSRGDVTILPTLVINNVQYRGRLERTPVLKAICAGFKETTDPPICLSGDLETNECLERNGGGCWRDSRSNISACKDTFRGRVCECPTVNGIRYHGDGYTFCEATGPERCTMNNGGCWLETRDGHTFTACTEEWKGCTCPPGFRGNGYECQDIDECKEKVSCQCDGCTCTNTWGGYECKCKGDLLYIKDLDTCIGNSSSIGWLAKFLIMSAFLGVCLAGYIFYKYRFRTFMDKEVMAIMSQYMPLDSHPNENQPLRQGLI